MIPYIAFAALLALIALIQAQDAKKERWGLLSFFIVSLFVGLRFEIGFDWLAYERIWQDSAPITEFLTSNISFWDPRVEAGYQLLNIAVKTFTDSFEMLQLVIAVLNCLVLHKVFKKISPANTCACWLVYMCLAGIPVQMVILRQALASSCVLLGLLDVIENKRFRGLVWIGVAFTFHISTIVFLPLVFLATRPPNKLTSAFILVSFLGLFLLSETGLVQFLMSNLAALSFLTDRVSSYLDIAASQISIGTYFLILAHTTLLVLFVFHKSNPVKSMPPERSFAGSVDQQSKKVETRIVSLAIWLTIYVLGAHLLFSDFPSIWNRTMAVSIPWQISAFWRSSMISNQKQDKRMLILLGLALLSFISIFYQISRPQSATVPYSSVLNVWLYGDDGTRRADIIQLQKEIWNGN